MKLKEDKFSLTISFEWPDWKNGHARAVIDAIKSLPYTCRKYNSVTKEWTVVNDSNYKERILRAAKMDESWEFDFDEYWEEVERKNDDSIAGDKVQDRAGS